MIMICGMKEERRGEPPPNSSFFKEKENELYAQWQHATQSSPSFIKQTHVWKHLVASELEEKRR